jgi:probable F420-dependent oxidoreductase
VPDEKLPIHPFRFGILLADSPSRQAWVDTVRRAEELGYTTLLIPDHFDGQLALVPALMAAADATTRLRLGSLVADNDFRHPLALAKEAATLDLLSEGRLELGVGAGFRPSDYAPTGIRCDEPAVRVERLEEAVLVIKGALRSQALNFSGRHYAVTEYTGRPAPVQSPIPLMIGGGGPRILRLAGREADIVGIAANLAPSQPDLGREYLSQRIEQKLQWVREGAGERFPDIELQTMVPIASVTDDSDGARAEAGARFGLTANEAADTLLLLVGSLDQMAETLMDRRRRLGISYYVFFAGAMEPLAPLVSRLTGS